MESRMHLLVSAGSEYLTSSFSLILVSFFEARGWKIRSDFRTFPNTFQHHIHVYWQKQASVRIKLSKMLHLSWLCTWILPRCNEKPVPGRLLHFRQSKTAKRSSFLNFIISASDQTEGDCRVDIYAMHLLKKGDLISALLALPEKARVLNPNFHMSDI